LPLALIHSLRYTEPTFRTPVLISAIAAIPFLAGSLVASPSAPPARDGQAAAADPG
jgi:hypothetical protein